MILTLLTWQSWVRQTSRLMISTIISWHSAVNFNILSLSLKPTALSFMISSLSSWQTIRFMISTIFNWHSGSFQHSVSHLNPLQEDIRFRLFHSYILWGREPVRFHLWSSLCLRCERIYAGGFVILTLTHEVDSQFGFITGVLSVRDANLCRTLICLAWRVWQYLTIPCLREETGPTH